MVNFIKDSLKTSVKIDTKALEVSDKYAEIKLDTVFYCEMLGIGRASFYRWQSNSKDMRKGSKHKGLKKYSEEHEQMVLRELKINADLTPDELIATCLDKVNENNEPVGYYLGSRSYVYRLMHKHNLINNCRSGRGGVKHNFNRKRLTATGPNQVWCWDITYLYSDIEGEYFYLYAILDLYSRLLVHVEVHKEQSDTRAAKFLEKALLKHHIAIKGHLRKGEAVNDDLVVCDRLILHSDNGGPMKGQNMLFKMASLGVESSYSRPHQSNDNAFAESLFATLKHSHHMPIPKSFDSVTTAQKWADEFADWYNNCHLHSGINFITPAQCHRGEGPEIMEKRNEIIAKSLIPKSHKFKMPSKVSLMSFATRRKRVEKAVKENEYKAGSKAVNAA